MSTSVLRRMRTIRRCGDSSVSRPLAMPGGGSPGDPPRARSGGRSARDSRASTLPRRAPSSAISSSSVGEIGALADHIEPAAGQVGALACIGDAPIALDVVSRPEVFAALHDRVVRGYALDALSAHRARGQVADPTVAGAFLARALTASRRPVRTPGSATPTPSSGRRSSAAASRSKTSCSPSARFPARSPATRSPAASRGRHAGGCGERRPTGRAGPDGRSSRLTALRPVGSSASRRRGADGWPWWPAVPRTWRAVRAPARAPSTRRPPGCARTPRSSPRAGVGSSPVRSAPSRSRTRSACRGRR